jgi:hypothetical protein
MAQSGHLGEGESDMANLVTVNVMFDSDAHVYVATSDELPGLVTEAEDIPALRDKLLAIIPELAELNGFELPRRVRLHPVTSPAESNGFADTTLALV